jgi:hypothetical protein
MSEPIEKPIFGIAVHTLEGMAVSGPSTRFGAPVPDSLAGEGVVDLHIPKLLLVPGTYDLGCSLNDYTGSMTYDLRHRALRFDVMHGEPEEYAGVVSLDGTWSAPDFGGRR